MAFVMSQCGCLFRLNLRGITSVTVTIASHFKAVHDGLLHAKTASKHVWLT